MEEIGKVESTNVKLQQFIQKYNELCKEMGYKIVVNPKFISRDDGTFSIILDYTISETRK